MSFVPIHQSRAVRPRLPEVPRRARVSALHGSTESYTGLFFSISTSHQPKWTASRWSSSRVSVVVSVWPALRQAVRRVPGRGEHVQHARRRSPARRRRCSRPSAARAGRRARTGSSRRRCPGCPGTCTRWRTPCCVSSHDAEDVDAAVLADDRLADPDLAIDLQRARARTAGRRRPRPGWRTRRRSCAASATELEQIGLAGRRRRRHVGRHAALAERRAAAAPASRTASGFRSLPRNRRPSRAGGDADAARAHERIGHDLARLRALADQHLGDLRRLLRRVAAADARHAR